MSQTEQTIEVDDAVVKAISDSVMESIKPQLDAMKPAEKEVNKLESKSQAVEGEVVGKFDKLSKEAFACEQMRAFINKDFDKLSELNVKAMESLKNAGLIEKGTYLNVGTNGDGGYIVPNADLLGDVMNILPTFSPLMSELRVITLTDGNSLDVATLTADVAISEVSSEGGTKSVTKPTFGQKLVSVREWAGITLLTKKLLAQAQMDVYAILRDSYARAIAYNRENLVLNDSASGILNQSGIVSMQLATGNTSVNNFKWEDIKSMPYKVPVQSAAGGIYVVSRLLLAHLDTLVATTGQPIVTLDSGSAGALTGRFANGYRFVVAESLGTADAVSTVFAVFGNFAQYGIVLRQGAIDTAVFDSGSVVDGSSVTHNLIQQNKLAMRVEFWENVGFPLPGAFVVAKTSAT